MAEEAGRQGAPDREVAAEGSRSREEAPVADARDGHDQCPACGCQAVETLAGNAPEEEPSWPEYDDPPLPTRTYRKRTSESRTVIKSVRFTPTAERVITKAAGCRAFAAFVGDSAYAAALGRTVGASPEDDPIRPLVERLEKLTAELRRVGNNLNQVARATNAGAAPVYADAVLARVEIAVDGIYRLLDQFLEEEAS